MLMTLYRGFLKAMQPELGSEGFDFLVGSASELQLLGCC
jgi:hypothetical protein